ncbi:cytosol aminopeptidase [Nematostella vectensis]|uniref:cytosol aminopeptidase n=1 Tax=Nematostella vectensis TaxID=45351 RepID=UPI002076F08F|nr:cytosol aminopeptidase [Nematostella vectensis]
MISRSALVSCRRLLHKPTCRITRGQRYLCSKPEAVINRGVVLGAYEAKKNENAEIKFIFTQASDSFNKKTSGRLREILKISGFEGKLGKSKAFYGIDTDYPCVVAVGLGKKDHSVDEETIEEKEESANIRHAAAAGARALREAGVRSGEIEPFTDAQAAAEGAHLALYSFDKLKSPKKHKLDVNLEMFKRIPDIHRFEEPWSTGQILADAQNFARQLMDMPANLMTPRIFADTVGLRLDKLSNVEFNIREKSWAEEKGMGAFLSVGKASTEDPLFLEISYKGAENGAPPIVLVGKGVTFDSGGISLKPSARMSLMKADMGGAAAVCSALVAIATLQLPINVTVLTPLCENMVAGNANKPGDVITASNGKTIEVDNTDAEGRLILADALCHANTLSPAAIIDVATLTGAMDISLGQGAVGVFTNSSLLWKHVYQAGLESGERMWRLPLYKHYSKQIESEVADLRNTGKTRSAGSCTAAVFLKEFVECDTWAHMDIAGVMHHTDALPYLGKGMSGRPTRALVDIARRISQDPFILGKR